VASVVVDGLVVPISVGGHPALDFCNTRTGWGQPVPKEYLHTHAHLTVWARENGLLPAAAVPGLRRAARREPDAATAVVTRAVALRDALRAVLLGPGGRTAWAAVAEEARRAGATAAPVPDPARPGGVPAAWRLDGGLDLPLRAVAWSAAGFLTSPGADRVAACPGSGCGWVFLDPRGRRRWCSMSWCGNRAKARRHAQRRRQTVT